MKGNCLSIYDILFASPLKALYTFKNEHFHQTKRSASGGCINKSYTRSTSSCFSDYWVNRNCLSNSVKSDRGCTSRIFFDNVTLMLHNVTLTSQKPCQHNNKCDCSKNSRKKFMFFQLRYSDILLKIHKFH